MVKQENHHYHHGNLRVALLAAATGLLAEKGPAALSLRAAAKAAGVSHAAPYRHFADKAALLEAIASEGFRRLTAACAAAERDAPDDPARQLVEAGLGYLRFALEHPAVVQLMFNGGVDLEHSGAELSQASGEALQSLVRIVENGKRAGLYTATPAYELTMAAWSMVHGLSLLAVTGPLRAEASSPARTEQLGRSVAQVLLNGMLRRPEADGPT
ncbi:MAG: TetR/AcrR family transcriptional regulator [Gammaproteobacteria bacterium]